MTFWRSHWSYTMTCARHGIAYCFTSLMLLFSSSLFIFLLFVSIFFFFTHIFIIHVCRIGSRSLLSLGWRWQSYKLYSWYIYSVATGNTSVCGGRTSYHHITTSFSSEETLLFLVLIEECGTATRMLNPGWPLIPVHLVIGAIYFHHYASDEGL